VVVLLAESAPAAATLKLFLCGCETVVGVLQEDERQDRRRVLAREQARVRPELVGGVPEALLEVGWEGHGNPVLQQLGAGLDRFTTPKVPSPQPPAPTTGVPPESALRGLRFASLSRSAMSSASHTTKTLSLSRRTHDGGARRHRFRRGRGAWRLARVAHDRDHTLGERGQCVSRPDAALLPPASTSLLGGRSRPSDVVGPCHVGRTSSPTVENAPSMEGNTRENEESAPHDRTQRCSTRKHLVSRRKEPSFRRCTSSPRRVNASYDRGECFPPWKATRARTREARLTIVRNTASAR
jgi:hypothetical protein